MARIAGIDLPREKRAEIGLTYIYGIGRSRSNEILKKPVSIRIRRLKISPKPNYRKFAGSWTDTSWRATSDAMSI